MSLVERAEEMSFDRHTLRHKQLKQLTPLLRSNGCVLLAAPQSRSTTTPVPYITRTDTNLLMPTTVESWLRAAGCSSYAQRSASPSPWCASAELAWRHSAIRTPSPWTPTESHPDASYQLRRRVIVTRPQTSTRICSVRRRSKPRREKLLLFMSVVWRGAA